MSSPAVTPGVPAYRLWPPVATGVPLVAGWLATRWWGDPLALPAWSVPLGWVLVGAFAVWNGWALLLFHRHHTGLLPGQPARRLMTGGPFAVSRNPLYLGLMVLYVGLALVLPSLWALLLAPVATLGLDRGAIRPEEALLRAEFGSAYEEYARSVRRWL